MPIGLKCAMAKIELRKAAESARKSTPFEKAATLARASYLSSPKTLGKILGSHVAWGATLELGVRPVASGIDYLMAVARHATTNPEMTVAEMREVPNISLAGFRAGGLGFKEGLKKAVTIMKTTIDPDELQRDFDLHGTHFDHPWLERAVNQIGASHGSIYKPFWQWAHATSLHYQAVVQAMHEGLKGAERDARAQVLAAHPTEEMTLRAIEDANGAAFQNPTAVGQAISRFQNALRDAGTAKAFREQSPRTAAAMRVSGQAGYLASKIIVPFTQIPTALAGVFIDMSPLGIAKTLAEMVPKESRSQARLATGLAKGIIGTGGLMTLGYALGRHGLMTGSYPTDPKEQAEWQATGRQENSIKIKGVWHNLQPLEPVMFMAILGANIAQAQRDNPGISTGDMAATAGVSMAKTLADQPYLMGLQQATGALDDPAKEGPKLVSGMIPVPSILGQVARGLDPQVRQTNGILQRLQAKIPIASQSLPPKIDQFGQPITRTGGFFGQVLNPATASRATDDAVTQELERLHVFPGMPSRTATVNGAHIRKTPEQYNEELKTSGPVLHQVLQQTMQNPGYQALPEDQQRLVLQKIILNIRAAATQQSKARLVQSGRVPQ